MNCDLHTHSRASDGELEPLELFRRAKANAVTRLALTDHDTIDGYLELDRLLSAGDEQWDGELVAGVELSAHWQGRSCHIVGLWIDPASSPLTTFLSGQRQVREDRAEAMDKRLQKAGISGALAGARELAGTAVLSRPHFARYLVGAGHCANEQQAFKRWLGRGKCADIGCRWPPLAEVVDVILSAGGIPVLAHPDKYSFTRTKLKQLLADFVDCGGAALELLSGRQQANVTASLLRLADEYGLASSLGSDFHSCAQHWCDVGSMGELPAAAVPVWTLPAASPSPQPVASSL